MIFEQGVAVRMLGICHEVTERIGCRGTAQPPAARSAGAALSATDGDRHRAALNDVVSTVALALPVDFVKVLELMPGGADLLTRAGFGWAGLHRLDRAVGRDDYARYISALRSGRQHRFQCRDALYRSAFCTRTAASAA